MLDQSDLLQLFQAIESEALENSPIPITGPVVANYTGQTLVYRVPVMVNEKPQEIIVTSSPMFAPNDFPGTLLGNYIVAGSPRFSTTVWLQEGQDPPAPADTSSTTPADTSSTTPAATTPATATPTAAAA